MLSKFGKKTTVFNKDAPNYKKIIIINIKRKFKKGKKF